jgi:hypothetical protein
MLLGMLATVAVLVFVATASAGQVTKIMYAQENSDVYTYQNTSGSTGTLSVSIGWTDIATGVATTYPVGEVDGDIFSGPAGTPYTDLALTVSSVQTLDVGTNPEVGSCSLPNNQTAYIAVLPLAGDNNYSIYVYFNGVLVSGYPKTAQAYGSNGEVYVPSDGDWISCAQYWPGGGANPLYASWTDQVYQRVAPGNPFDVLSAQLSQGFLAPQLTQRTIIGGSGHPQSSEWYGVTPQIWPGANVPNSLVNGVPQPGTVSATTAPLWYTYSYPDASVTGNPVAYFLSSLTNASASKRNMTVLGSPSESCTYKFYGTSLTLVYTKTSAGGLASIKVDNNDGNFVEKAPTGGLDMYSASPVFQTKYAITGLTNSWHNVVVKSLNPAHNTASSGWFVYVDAFDVDAVPQNPVDRSENNYDGQVSYHWSTLANTYADGGSMSTNGSFSAATAFTFSGPSVSYVYEKTSAGGLADVYIDGVFQGTVNEYSATPVFQATQDYGPLANTTHTIMILNHKTANPPSSSTFIYVDSFIVPEDTGTHYQN